MKVWKARRNQKRFNAMPEWGKAAARIGGVDPESLECRFPDKYPLS